MKSRSLIAAAVTSAFLFSGCNSQGPGGQTVAPGAATAPAPENVVATVNGKPITKQAIATMIAEIQQRRGPEAAAEDKVIDEMISRELMRQEVEKQNVMLDPAYAGRLENMTRVLVSQIAAEHFLKDVTISDEEAKQEYDNRIGAMKMTEFRARHILVDKEETAKDILAKLQKGAKFEDLAKKLSKDPGSKDHGGELGWFNPQQMVQPFADAVAGLKDGELVAAPVQTQFGWHVIQREEAREQKPPAFDEVKDQIKNVLKTQKLQQHVADLKAAAKIERMAKKEEAPTPAAQAPAPTEGAQKEEGAPEPSMEAGKPQSEKPAEVAPPLGAEPAAEGSEKK